MSDVETEIFFKKVIKQIEPQLKYELFIVDANIQNAFTTVDKNGNNIIVVFTGLIKHTEASEILGILCHEIGHIHHKHILNMMYVINQSRNSLLQRLLLLVPIVNVIFLSAEFNNHMIYSQQNENEADLYAFHKMNQLKWPILGLINFFEKISYEEFKNYWSSHPYSAYRSMVARKFLVTEHKLPQHILHAYNSIRSRIRKKLYTHANSPKSDQINGNYEKSWDEYLNMNYHLATIDKSIKQKINANHSVNCEVNSPQQNSEINSQTNRQDLANNDIQQTSSQKDAQYYGMLYLKAQILTKLKKYNDAIKLFETIWVESGSYRALYSKILWTLIYNKDSSPQILNEIINYQKCNPNDPEILQAFAYYYELQKNRGAFFYYKAEHALSCHNTKKAKKYLQSAFKILERTPTSPFYLKAIDLQKLLHQQN